MPPLSHALFREVRPEFFRVLAGPAARLYVDALDGLERESAQRPHGMEREEALALVERAVEAHAEVALENGEPLTLPVREKARVVLELLKNAGWVEEEERSDWQRFVHFHPHGSVLLQGMRRIAFPDAAVFSDKLVNVCVTLANHEALADQPWAQVETCVANLQAGLIELAAMQKLIARHIRQQLAAATLKESLAVLFDQFAPLIGRACYAELVRSRLPTRLANAQTAVDELQQDAKLLALMQSEVLRRDPGLPGDVALSRVRARLDEIGDLLDQVVPLADAVDRRTAELTRRSLARFRYLQEVTGENRQRVQTFFETLNRHFAGQRVTEIDEEALAIPALLLHDTRILAGLESLYTPRLRRAASEIAPLDDEASELQHDRALGQLSAAMRDSLTVARANRYVAALPEALGAAISSELLPIHNEDDLADIIACLLHGHASDARFAINVPRRETDADEPSFDVRLSYRIERFTLLRK